jgi:hypothetical protein
MRFPDFLRTTVLLFAGAATALAAVAIAGAAAKDDRTLLYAALAWRKQSAAVEAIEGRDGVRFYVEHTSPFKPTSLIRTPGFRRVEPVSGGNASADDRVRATRACSPRDPGRSTRAWP